MVLSALPSLHAPITSVPPLPLILIFLLLFHFLLLLFFIFFVFFSFFILPSSSPSPPSFTLYVFVSFFFLPSISIFVSSLVLPQYVMCCSNCSPNSLRLSTLASPIRIHNTYPHCRLYPHLTTYRKSSGNIWITYCIRTSVQLRLSAYPQYFFIHTLQGDCSISGT